MVAFLRCLAISMTLSVSAGGSSVLPQARPQDALVLVDFLGHGECVVSHGVVIGDGSLVVAGCRGVLGTSAGRRRHLAGCITVVSPYRGDVADAEVVACDTRTCLALLRVPWRGHPALSLADDRSILRAKRIALVGMPEVIAALTGKGQFRADGSSPFREATCDVDYVAVRADRPLFVHLKIPDDFPNWGVGPMLLPDTNQVAALVMFRLSGGEVEGVVLNRVAGLRDRLRAWDGSGRDESADRPVEHAGEAFDLCVRIWTLSRERGYEECAVLCRKFIELRPNRFFGYAHAALVAEELGRVDEAERFHREAVTRSPDSFLAQVSHGGFLVRQNRPEEAMQVFESLWPRVSQRPYLSDTIYTVLSKNHEHARCRRFLEEALAIEPNDASLLICLGNTCNALQEYEAAADAFGRAARLWPEHETVRSHYARNLELAGRWDEAEVQHRRAVEAHPGNEYAHHTFASFLARHRPELKTEALKEARLALRVHDGSASDREKLERLIQELESRRE